MVWKGEALAEGEMGYGSARDHVGDKGILIGSIVVMKEAKDKSLRQWGVVKQKMKQFLAENIFNM